MPRPAHGGDAAHIVAPEVDEHHVLGALLGVGEQFRGNARIVFRVNTYMGVLDACRAGMGLALLPCFLADDDPHLERLGAPNRDLDIGLWLLTHEELRHTARVRAFMDFMGQTIERVRPALEGERPAARANAPFVLRETVEVMI